MNIKELNEELQKITEGDVRTGKMLQTGHTWTEEKVGEKEVEILGVILKYDILEFKVEDADETEKDRTKFRIQNPEAIAEIEKILNASIEKVLGDKVSSGEARMIGITTGGEIR